MATPELVDQFGRPIDKSLLTRDIAAATVTGVRSPFAGYPADGLTPGKLAAILRSADQGEPLSYFELAETIEERDLHYLGVLGTRKRSVAQIDIRVEAAADDQESVKHADMIRAWLSRDELQDELFDVLDAIGKGISFTEIVWDVSEGQWMPSRLEWRDPRWFRFAYEDGRTALLREIGGDQPLPAFKFIVARIKAKSGLPIRSGLARAAAWAWMFKAFTQKDWAIFTQSFGQPIRVGKYRAGATQEEKDTLFRAVANIAADCAAIVPETMLIEFVESKTVQQSAEHYERRCNWLDQQMSKAVLGQTATTDAIAGGHAVGREHRKVQEDIERADAKALAAVLNRDLVMPWVALEYGPQKAYPRIVIEDPEEQDVKLIVESVKTLVPMGLKVQASDMRDLLGLAEPDDDAELLTAPAAGIRDQVSGASDVTVEDQTQKPKEPVPKDEIDKLADDAQDLAGPSMDALIDTVRKLVGEVTTLDELRDRLLELQSSMPEARLADAMRLAFAFAELSGRSEIANPQT